MSCVLCGVMCCVVNCVFRLRAALDPFVCFLHEMTDSTYNATVDVYAPSFFCDFFNFFVVVFGYQGFGPSVRFMCIYFLPVLSF